MKSHALHGYVHGFSQQAVVFQLPEESFNSSEDVGPRLWKSIQINKAESVFFKDILGRFTPPKTATAAVGSSMALCLIRLLDGVGMPVSDPPVIRNVPGDNAVSVTVPVYDPQTALVVIRWLYTVATKLKEDVNLDSLPRSERAPFVQILHFLDQAAPPGANGIRLMRAAQELDIPFLALADGIHVYGWGSKGRWLKGTVTDETPGLGRALCGDKVATKEVLAQAGIPVAPGVLVTSADQAVRAAAQLGYPVVVKPSDRDRGEAVFAGLTTPDDVAASYGSAARQSDRVMVEKHVPGQSFRAHVYQGKVWILSVRTPAGVAGDGKHDVATLVEMENARRKVERTLIAQLSPIKIDAEAKALLAEQSLDLTSVPKAGDFIQLKRAANASTGGRLFAVEEPLHPENEKLFQRTAAVLRMDLTGLDIVAPDLSRPWYETGLTVIEANAGPQLSMLFPEKDKQLLQAYVTDRGRLNSVLLLADDAEAVENVIAAARAASETRIGVASAAGTWLGDEVISGPSADLYRATRQLVVNPACDAILVIARSPDILTGGLPLDRFDRTVVAEQSIGSHVSQELAENFEPERFGEITSLKGTPPLFGSERGTTSDVNQLLKDVVAHLVTPTTHV